ncbi:hypothetical protein ACMFMF_004382 [Clarireedia jacksonii]
MFTSSKKPLRRLEHPLSTSTVEPYFIISSHPTGCETTVRFRFFSISPVRLLGEGTDARHQQPHAKNLKSKKPRDSAERAKAVDVVYKHQISIHREKEKRRDSDARRKVKEQKREIQVKEKKLKDATKSLENAEVERKECARAVGITKTRSTLLWIQQKFASILPKSWGMDSYNISV